MSGNVVSVSVRQNVLSLHGAAQTDDGRGDDMSDRPVQGAAGRATRSGITSTALSVRRSIAISALALAYQSRSSVLLLLHSS